MVPTLCVIPVLLRLMAIVILLSVIWIVGAVREVITLFMHSRCVVRTCVLLTARMGAYYYFGAKRHEAPRQYRVSTGEVLDPS